MNININITQAQMSLIYDALETYYYICKDGSSKRKIEDIILLQAFLHKQKLEQVHPENKKGE